MIPGEVHDLESETSIDQRRVGQRWRVAEWTLLLLAPPSAWLAFGIVLINQDFFIDPWYYVGYGRAFTVLYEMFGWRYYAVRFPVMMLNELSLSGVHPLIGYAVLRYLLVLGCGLPLYAWARRELGRTPAAIGYLFLVCNPLLPRIILWDLTTFVAVPMALAGFAVWLLSDRLPWRALSGFLMMASVASHTFTGTAVAAFLAVQVVRRLRARDLRRLLLNDVAATAGGAAACFAIGCAYYLARVGPFDPTLLVTVPAETIAIGQEYVVTHSTPFSVWAAREYHVYVPPLCVAMSAVLLGRRVLENTAVASVWWFAAIYTVGYGIYQFVFNSFVLETFYYFAHLTLVVYLLIPVLVAGFSNVRSRQPQRVLAFAGAAALLVLPLTNHQAPSLGDWLDNYAYSNVPLLAGMLVAAALLVAGGRTLVSNGAGAMALGLFLLCVQAFTLLSPIHRRVFDSQHRDRETAVYVAALQMLDVFEEFSKPGARVIPWHCPTQYSMGSIASTVLVYSLSDPWSKGPCEARIGDFEVGQLRARPRYVLLMNEHPEIFDAQETALRGAGYQVKERLTKTIGGDAYRATIRLVEILQETP
ncbi:MAG TPA: hypothetical protein VFV95_09380 [Vicinamibacterales bacterium]|nr:hypothetical protein [Vicinamibacterales bacterium]